MAYLKPPLFVQVVFNRLVMAFGWFDSTTLVVPRRGGAEPQRIPVIPVDVQGVRYLVSTRGEAMWVRNLRSSGQCELSRGGKSETFKATEVPVGERGPLLEAYRRKAGKQVDGYFAALPDAADHPVFRIESRP